MIHLVRDDITLAASVSCFDLSELAEEVKRVEQSAVKLLHFDVVDGHFNDCIILGTPTLLALRRVTKLPIEVHLAVYNPEKYLDQYIEAGADYIAVHYEVMTDPLRIFDAIRKKGAKPILAFRADTMPRADTLSLLNEIEWVLKLTVNPGYSGQKIQTAALAHIAALRDMITQTGKSIGIQSDGNMKAETIPLAIASGADMITGGTSGLFIKGHTVKANADILLDIARAHLQK